MSSVEDIRLALMSQHRQLIDRGVATKHNVFSLAYRSNGNGSAAPLVVGSSFIVGECITRQGRFQDLVVSRTEKDETGKKVKRQYLVTWSNRDDAIARRNRRYPTEVPVDLIGSVSLSASA
ncbi:MAG: hypothetical protein PHI63_04960 [Patescibacteria group bacterium]|nr:hypothetical protein [Patescibacteria group bacterium]